MKFDIEEYKKNPERKLILRNFTDQGPSYWDIEEIQVSLGDIVIIKIPDRNIDFPSHVPLDKDLNLVHEIHGKIGSLEFANEKLTMLQFVEKLSKLPIDCTFDFSCQDNNEACFGVTKLKRFDSVILLFSQYGGSCAGCYDISEKVDAEDLEAYLKCYLEDFYVEYFYVDTVNIDKELWGVSFEFENIDGETFRRLAISNSPFFNSRSEAEKWISDHPYKDFDEDFDNDYCSDPQPVLIDRWSISKYNGHCSKSI